MKGILFDNLTIEISDETPHIGSLWKRDGNNWRAYDEPALRWIHERARLYEAPVFLDVGAHTGLFTCLAAHHPTAHVGHRGMCVIALEPNLSVGDELWKNIKLNNLFYCVHVSAIALSDKDKMTTLNVPRNNTQVGMATLGKPRRFKEWKTIEVNTQRLDTFLSRRGIFPINIIKLDTEGAELSILRGGENTIRTYKPDMLIEYERKNTKQFGYEPIEIRRLLESWGATCEDLPPRDLVVTWGDR